MPIWFQTAARIALTAALFLSLIGGPVEAQEPQLQAAIDSLDVEYLRAQLENTDALAQLALIYGFFSDYYSYIEEDRRTARQYTDLTITTAEAAVERSESAALYSLIADAYSKKLTGPFTALRYGSRITRAIDKAEELDAESEALLYVQAKRYLLAPALFGGDREQAIESFTRLIERNPNSSLYHTFLAESYKPDHPEQAQLLFAKALELAANNAWAERELQGE